MFILFLFINLFNFYIIALPNIPLFDQKNQTLQNKFLKQNKEFLNIQRNNPIISSISGCLFCALCGLPDFSLPSSGWMRTTSEDQSIKCKEFINLCDDGIYKHFLRSQCPYSCGICLETKINEKNITKTSKTLLTTTLTPKTTKNIKTSLKPKTTTKTIKTTLKHKNIRKESYEQIKEKKKTKTPKIIENIKEIEKTTKTNVLITTTTIPTKTIDEITITNEISTEENIEENFEDCEDIGQNCKAMESGCQDIGQLFCGPAIGGSQNPCQSPLLQRPGLTLTEELMDGQKVCCGFDKPITGYLPDGQKEDSNLRKRKRGSKLVCKNAITIPISNGNIIPKCPSKLFYDLNKDKCCLPGKPSDCPLNKYRCNDTLWYDLMTEQCPKTCNRCEENLKLNISRIKVCKDGIGPNGISECPQYAFRCKEKIWKEFMEKECPKTCGICNNLNIKKGMKRKRKQKSTTITTTLITTKIQP
ncbi:hypothetical protein Mgra_00003300 [Meloidogyne graminicola]|uniref:ShKT domain-containing protein n=1 Tax=Meloidogyne graminicola TaxID=189291 RepID=A0A8S9ZWL7_9BILA|nr:hypothetical protein Mgra_00003300 [Meloidogyne graminicola]